MNAEIVSQLLEQAGPYLSAAVREDAELARGVATVLPAAGGVTVNVSGDRAIGAQHIGIAVSADNATIHPRLR
ncbi:hypothetical protein [Streptomyces longwoodensis]|uniref:hypothetical protein n=1 Tax=Streptomyces longwoodensis TaxID=68231 RepID=UPI0033E84195